MLEETSSFLNTAVPVVALSVAKVALLTACYVLARIFVHGVAVRLLRPAFDRVAERQDARTARVRALETILHSSADFILGFVALVMLLQIFGFNIIPLLTTAGVAGLAVGFGAQKLIRDVIGGFFIIIEDQYGVGDYVTIGAITGTVETLGMRTTSIRDSQGRLTIISNGTMDQICNHSRGIYTLYIDYAVAPDKSPDVVRSVLSEALTLLQNEMCGVVVNAGICDGFTAISGLSKTYRVDIQTQPALAENVRIRFNDYVAAGFSESGIDLV